MQFKKVFLSELIPAGYNPRKNLKSGDPEYERIKRSISEFGYVDPVIINSDNTVIGGHQRLNVLKDLGHTQIDVVVVDLPKGKEKALNIALNKITGEWDNDLLTNLLSELKDDGEDISLTGFDDKEFASMLRELHKDDEVDDAEPQISRAEELQKEWHTELGQMWQCGDHRVICGDCTDDAIVARLMDGGALGVLFTSPPYSDMRTYADGTDVTISKLIQFIPVFKEYVDYQIVNLGIQRKDGAIIQYWDEYIKSAKDVGYKLLSWNVWDRGRGGSVGSMSAMFPIEHEWIFVFGEKPKKLTPTIKNDTAGEKTRWRNMDRTGEYGGYKEGTKSEYGRLGTVVACRMVNKNADHPAQFPIEIPTGYIEAMTMVGGIVADPFLGSGTTMIACENLGRKCRGCEISPKYVAVILQRYKDLTGNDPVLMEDV